MEAEVRFFCCLSSAPVPWNYSEFSQLGQWLGTHYAVLRARR